MLRDMTLALRLCWQKNSKRLLDARLVISPSLIGSGEECSIKEHGGIKRKSKSCYCFLCRHVVYGIECQRIKSSLSEFFYSFEIVLNKSKYLKALFQYLISFRFKNPWPFFYFSRTIDNLRNLYGNKHL